MSQIEPITFTARNDCACMPHTSSWRSRNTCNECHYRFGIGPCLVIFLQIISRFFFHGSSNFTNENDTCLVQTKNGNEYVLNIDRTFGVGIVKEHLDNVDMLRAREWITTNTDT